MNTAVKEKVKPWLRNLGLYSVVRHWYRRLDPEVRRSRAAEQRFYRRLIGDGDLCFDIGANVGQTVEIWVPCNARIIAVEPNPLCIRTLNWEFGGHRNVTIVEKAVGSTGGFADLHFEGTNSTGSLRADWPFPNRMVRRVALTTLDELIAQFGRPRLCKVDVEGYEAEVFKGLSQPIPILCFEFIRDGLQRALDCIARLEEIGPIRSASVANHDNTGYLAQGLKSREELTEYLNQSGADAGNIVVEMCD